MPSFHQTRPIIINDQRPATQKTSSLSPSTPPSPKTVRFAPQSAQLASRPLSPKEAWSLYYYETHSRACRLCASRSLCPVGYGLAQDVRVLVCQYDGQLCSTQLDEDGKRVRVEVPHGYDSVKNLLGGERARKERKKRAPVVSYSILDDEPRPSRKREARDVVVEPARSHRDDERRSKQKPQRYETVEVVPESSERERKYEKGGPVQLPERPKRGSLYESDMRRPRREYRIEERVPEKRERREEGRGRDGEWKEREREERRERRRREREEEARGPR